MERLKRSFYQGPAEQLAPELLNKLLVVGSVSVRIIEVEAYGGADEASHGFRGKTKRNRSMFGPAGHLYVYRSYGIHNCMNVVCGSENDPQAVLLRAGELITGEDVVASRRAGIASHLWLAGPGRICKALAIGPEHDGVDLATKGPVGIFDEGRSAPPRPGQGGRVGISKAKHLPWRWWVPGHPGLSKPPIDP